MSASRAICSRCSSQLLPTAMPRLGAVARFATLTDDGSASSQHSTTATTHTREARVKPAPAAPLSGPSRRRSKARDDSAMALFNDVVNPTAIDSSSATTPILTELEILTKLNQITAKAKPGHRDFVEFREKIWPCIEKMPGQMPKPIYHAAIDILSRMRTDPWWISSHPGQSLELANMYKALGKFSLEYRSSMILRLCFSLINGKHQTRKRRVILREILGLWKHVSQLKRSGEVDPNRFALPTTSDVLKDLNRRPELPENEKRPLTPGRALCAIFLMFPPLEANVLLPALLATVAVLSDKRYTGQWVLIQAAPLLELVQEVVQKIPPPTQSGLHPTATANLHGVFTPEVISDIFKEGIREPTEANDQLQAYVINQLSYMNVLIMHESGRWQEGLRDQNKMDPELAKVVNLGTFHRQLRTAYRSRNTGAILSIWHSMKATMKTHPSLSVEIREDPHFMDYWVFVWCGIVKPQKLHETMELMQELGIEATLKTYTSMMHGWRLCKDTDKIEALWAQLRQSGMKLDMFIWTERISALVSAGKVKEGVNALHEVVALWQKAVKDGREEYAVEPTIATVNAAFKGLLRYGFSQEAHELLSWAGRQGFDPDARTYNILLRETLREDNSDEAKNLLRAMKDQGVEPDAATFTILLEGVLGRMGEGVTVEEQLQAIEEVFDEIEASGMKPGLETYAKMLYAVASLSKGSDEAVAKVQDHMVKSGFTTTPHMVTILIERALDRDPPDINAVRHLLRKHKLNSIEQGDQTLWERAMSAFAVGGEKKDAMALFNKLTDAGRPVTSLPCLTDLLRMLLEHDDMEAAQHIVSIVLSEKLKRSDKFNERYWRHHFWHLAKENGLLRRDDLPVELRS